ncbi:protein Son-like isoform X3 [Nymphalis io]|uniref:protein Son-like isoform X3 n=1 Tax=Inachis io TaxID=171585 RepID=UPI002166E4E5|nr:protein Son-like isoform X3 [Nymphalis io]
MASLINKIEMLIKREKTTPERKKDDTTKSSSEILSELFSAFNADPPKIDETSHKKSKKSKKKHKKDKKKRSRSVSSGSDSDKSEYSHKRKKRKKAKSKKRKEIRSPSIGRSGTPEIKPKTESLKTKIKKESIQFKPETKIKKETKIDRVLENKVSIKTVDSNNKNSSLNIDASMIPMPESPKVIKLESNDLRLQLDKKVDSTTESDKAKGKIQIKNLKFSAVFEETVKKAEEEARKKAEKVEEGEYTDSSSSLEKDEEPNSQFPKSSDPGGILKQQAAEEVKVPDKLSNEDKSSTKQKQPESTNKPSKKERSRSRKRSTSKSRRSRSHSTSRRRRHRSRSKSRRRSRSRHRSRSKRRSKSRSRRRSSSKSRHRSSSKARHRSSSKARHRSSSKARHRSSSKSKHRSRHYSPRHRSRRSRSPTGVKLADSEKKRLLEVARRNAINMLKNGAVPAGAAVLPPHTRNQVMAAIQSGGKSVDELTDFCKHLSKKEALGELSSVSSNDDNMSENEDTIAFHHPFLVKEKAPIVMNIRGGAPLPAKSSVVPIANKEELRLQFPVSSGTQHREKASEWVPVSPKRDMQVAKLNSKSPTRSTTPPETLSICSAPLALPAPSSTTPSYLKSFTTGSQLSSVPALPAPGPQAYPPGVDSPMIDVESIVSQKLLMIRKEQEQNELDSTQGDMSIPQFGWTKESRPGQFTGSTGAHILTPRELASGTQAWAKKDQLVRAAPVEGGMGMQLLQKMGWTPGQGLGKEGTGTLQPLLLEVKLDTRGLTSKEEVSSRHGKSIKPQRLGRRGSAPLVAGGKHPVSLLGEYCSKQKLGPPEYNLCFECGPDHKKNFLFKVKVAGVEYQPAVASANKKQAKADAAQLALQKLGNCSQFRELAN